MKISIITAAWNSSSTLRDTMESVLRQTYSDWEHIIVDGASKDSTIDVIRDLEPKYNGRLKWVSEPDKGIYDAMNKGIAMATGDVIGILNSDDFFSTENVIASFVNEFSDSDIDAVYGDIHYVNDDDLTKCVRYYSSKSFRPWKMKMGFQPAHPSFYCRKSIYDKYGVFDIDFKVAADFEHLLRLIYVNRINAHYIPMDFVTMRTGGASTNGFESHKRIIKDHFCAYKKHGIRSGYYLDLMRYPFKIAEVLTSKLSKQ